MKLSRQKNALVGGLLGGVGGGQLVLLVLDAYTNVRLDDHQAAVLAGATSTGMLLAARPLRYLWAHGVRGSWARIVDGAGKAAAEPDAGAGAAAGGRTLTDEDVAAIADAVGRAAPATNDG